MGINTIPGGKNVRTLDLIVEVLTKCYGFPIYHVNFLREKACHNRWEKELKIVQHETKWCVLYFQLQKWIWEVQAQESGMQVGHKAYAYKQIFGRDLCRKESTNLRVR